MRVWYLCHAIDELLLIMWPVANQNADNASHDWILKHIFARNKTNEEAPTVVVHQIVNKSLITPLTVHCVFQCSTWWGQWRSRLHNALTFGLLVHYVNSTFIDLPSCYIKTPYNYYLKTIIIHSNFLKKGRTLIPYNARLYITWYVDS